ncbi:hypothetical protein NC651_008879 [Populus alba x Populus x berolinensis]|nr:hypothetical protein NC651_008879 [Populus alba x Populus x berolinensis]
MDEEAAAATQSLREINQLIRKREIFKALEIVASTPVDHMQCFGDAAGRLQESVLDAATNVSYCLMMIN